MGENILTALRSASERGLRTCASAAAVFAIVAAAAAAQAQNAVGIIGDAAAGIQIRLSTPAPAGGLAATVGLACDDAGGVTINGEDGDEVRNFTVADGGDLEGVDTVVSCARLWTVDFAAGAAEASFAPEIAASASGRLLEFFLADPAGGGGTINRAARYVAAARGLTVSFAAAGAAVVEEGQSAAITVSFSGAVGFPGAAASVTTVAAGDAAGTGDYRISGLTNGGLAAAVGASEGSFVLAATPDAEAESAGAGVVPHESVVLALADSRASGFAVGAAATLTVLIVESGNHSPISFNPARAAAAEGGMAVVNLSFNTLPTAFSVTLAGANSADDDEWSFAGFGCAALPTTNRCVITVAAGAGEARAGIGISDDDAPELAAEIRLALQGEPPPGYVFGAPIIVEVAASEINAADDDGNTSLMRAARAGDAAAVQAWIDAGALVNAQNKADATALDLANGLTNETTRGQIRALLKAVDGRCHNECDDDDVKLQAGGAIGATGLLAAARDGHDETVRAMLADQALEINPRDSDGNTPLILAAQNGHTQVVYWLLLRAGINVNARNNAGDNALILAAQNGHADVAEMLARRADTEVNAQDASDYTALVWAVGRGHDETVKKLLNASRVNINMQVTSRDYTALIWAVVKNRARAAAQLIAANGVLVNLQDRDGLTALDWANRDRREDIRALLIADGVGARCSAHCRNGDADLDGGAREMTALHIAAQDGNLAEVNLLLDNGAAVNAKNGDGDTPLMLAAENGHANVAAALRDAASVAINAKNDRGYTALLVAARAGHANVVTALLAHDDIQVNAVGNGNTALIWAAQAGYADVVTALLTHGDIQVNAAGGGGTALIRAARAGHADAVTALLTHNDIAVNPQDRSGYTALDWANSLTDDDNRAAIRGALLDDGARCSVICLDGDTDLDGNLRGPTALHIAARDGNLAEVNRLLENDAAANAQNGDGDTPLMLAAENGHAAVVSALLTVTGISLNIQNRDGDAALLLAADAGHTDAVTALLAEDDISVNLQNSNENNMAHNTALMAAAQNGHAAVVEALLDEPAVLVNLRNSYGEPALDLAVTGGHTDAAAALIGDSRIEINAQNRSGDTVLDLANLYRRNAIRALLIADGVGARCSSSCKPGDVDLQGNVQRGTTGLHTAAQNGAVNQVRDLAAAGYVRINALQTEAAGGATALDLANGLTNETTRGEIRALLKAVGGRCRRSCRAGDADLDGRTRRTTELHTAAQAGNAAEIRRLLAAGGIDINAKDENGYTPLMLTAANRRADAADALLDGAGILVDLQNDDGDGALILATKAGSAAVVRLLIDAEAAVNARGKDDLTALLWAAKLGYGGDAAAALLLADGIMVNLRDATGNTALDLANANKHNNIRKMLINPAVAALCNRICLPGDFDLQGAETRGTTELHTAAQSGPVAEIRRLLAEGYIRVNALDENGNTALDWANRNDRTRPRALLIAAGGRCNRICRTGDDSADGTERGTTELHTAAQNGDAAEVESLLNAGEIGVNTQDEDDNTALDFANRLNAGQNRDNIRALLINAGGRCARHCLDGDTDLDGAARATTELHTAAASGPTAKVGILLNLGEIPVNAKDRQGNTPLMLAAENSHTAAVALLLGAPGIAVNARNDAANTALIFAAEKGAAGAAEELLDAAGIAANARNNAGINALLAAAATGGGGGKNDYAAIVERLLSVAGIEIGVRDANGHTALLLAAAGGNALAVGRLVAAGAALDAQNNNGDTALDLANIFGRNDPRFGGHDARIVLIAPDIDARCSNVCRPGDTDLQGTVARGTTALHTAATNDDIDEVIALLAAGHIHLNAQSDGGNTALMTAMENAGAPLVEQMFAADGLDVNIQANGGSTALDMANRRNRNHIRYVMQPLDPRCNNSCRVGDVNLAGGKISGSKFEFLLAAEAGDAAAVANLLAQGQDVNARDDTYIRRSALIWAARGNRVQVIEVLLNTPGIEVNLQDNLHWTALIWAAANGHVETTKILLAADGINVNLTTRPAPDDSSDFHNPPHNHLEEILNGDSGYGTTVTGNLEYFTALDMTALYGRNNIRALLIAPGVDARCNILCGIGDLNLQGIAPSRGKTALHTAVEENNAEEVASLLAQGTTVKVNAQNDENGETALILATRLKYSHLALLLLAAPDIDVNLQSDDGWTALMWASHFGQTAVVAVLVADANIMINAQNPLTDFGTTALDYASFGGHASVRALLKRAGAKCNAICHGGDIRLGSAPPRGTTALHTAVQDDDAAAVTRLLAQGNININAQKSQNGETALILAARLYRRNEVARLLLAAPGIEVNLQSDSGWTALMEASHSGNTVLATALLANENINVNARASTPPGDQRDGWTALDYANANFQDRSEMSALLRADGARCNIRCQSGDVNLQGMTTP